MPSPLTFHDEEGTQGERIKIRPEERGECVLGRADYRFVGVVERRVQQNGDTGSAAESL